MIGQEIDKVTQRDRFSGIHLRKFQDLKDSLILIEVCLDKQQELGRPDRENTIQSILNQGHIPRKDSSSKKGFIPKFFSLPFLTTKEEHSEEEIIRYARRISFETTDVDFLSNISGVINDPLLGPSVSLVFDLAHQHFREWIGRHLKQLVPRSQHIQEQELKHQLRSMESSRRADRHRTSSLLLIQDMDDQSHSQTWVKFCFCVPLFLNHLVKGEFSK